MSGWNWPGSVVTNVVDGDSFDARVTRDLGFGGVVSFVVRLRLNRINTPPVKSPEGRAATALARQLMMAVPVHIVTLKPYKYGGPDSSPGEWMAEVTLADGRNVSDALIEAGVALPWDGAGGRPGG